jgi:hypothetical protein
MGSHFNALIQTNHSLNLYTHMPTRRFFTTLFLSLLCFSVFAQQLSPTGRPIVQVKNQVPILEIPTPVTGFEEYITSTTNVAIPEVSTMLRSIGIDEHAGNTIEELQTNGSEYARIHVWPDGEVTMAWLTAPINDGAAFPNRGTGYNSRSQWLAGNITDARIENRRTGFPNYVVTENGTEHVFAHRGINAFEYRIFYSRRDNTTNSWTSDTLPTNTPNGVLWCKAAADGNTIHLIAITTTAISQGPKYDGVDGHLLYWRSEDAGLTWNINEVKLPEIDSSHYRQIRGDGYTIIARNCTVAVGVFDPYSDIRVLKSTDCGATWAAYLVNDLPFDSIGFGVPYPPFDPPFPGAPGNDPYAMPSNDGCGSVVIDGLGNLHCFYGASWITNSALPSIGYYPLTNGLMYWRETDPTNKTIITGALDVDGDGVLNPAQSGLYGASGLCSMPSAAVDNNGDVYVVYSAIVEDLTSSDGINYRHLYAMKSPNYGDTWYDPVDIQYYQISDGDSTLAKKTEAVYPSCAKYAPSGLHLQYQIDTLPGNNGILSTGASSIGEVTYHNLSLFVDTKTPEKALHFGIVPNPSSTSAYVQLELEQAADTQIQLFDINGSLVRSMQMGTLSAGAQQIQVRTADLPNGAYFVRVQSAQQMGTAKLIVLKQ